MNDEQILDVIKSVCGFDGAGVERFRAEALIIGRAVEQASRRAALEEAASAALNASLDAIWADGRLMDAREVGSACAAAIRKLATETNNG